MYVLIRITGHYNDRDETNIAVSNDHGKLEERQATLEAQDAKYQQAVVEVDRRFKSELINHPFVQKPPKTIMWMGKEQHSKAVIEYRKAAGKYEINLHEQITQQLLQELNLPNDFLDYSVSQDDPRYTIEEVEEL